MGEKVVTKSEGEKNTAAAEGAEKAAAGGGEATMTVVLKLDLHCEGCAKKVRRSVAHLQGVVTVKADCHAKKLTVTGNVDPVLLREKVEIKTKKKVELISPQPNKDAGSGGAAAAGADKKAEEKKGEENKVDDIKKPKVVAVSTVTMKTKLHCDGCAHKIRRIIIKNFDGVDSLTTNLEKDLITVIGTMDVNDLVTFLKEKLKRGVEIVPPPKHDGAGGEAKAKEGTAGKEKAAGSSGGGEGLQDKKGKETDGDKKKEGGGDKKEPVSKPESEAGENLKTSGGGAGEEGRKMELSKMEHHSSYNPQTHYAMPMLMHNQQIYGHQDYGIAMHHHQSHMINAGYHVAGPPMPPPTYLDTNTNTNDNMFSDENPNGCYIM